MNAMQKLAATRHAELLGYRLATQVEDDEAFQAAVEAETGSGFAHAWAMEALYRDLRTLDCHNIRAVLRFLGAHFDTELRGMPGEQLVVCAKAFSAGITKGAEHEEATEA